MLDPDVQVAEETAKKIEAAAAAYTACSLRAAILYFVLNDLSNTDPMYQFSLDAYVDLFLISIQKSAKNDKVEDRIKNLNEYHTYAVYKYTARWGLWSVPDLPCAHPRMWGKCPEPPCLSSNGSLSTCSAMLEEDTLCLRKSTSPETNAVRTSLSSIRSRLDHRRA